MYAPKILRNVFRTILRGPNYVVTTHTGANLNLTLRKVQVFIHRRVVKAVKLLYEGEYE